MGFAWRNFRDLVVRACIQLGCPIALVWNSILLHLTAAGMKEFIDANAEWLTVFQLPALPTSARPRASGHRSSGPGQPGRRGPG